MFKVNERLVYVRPDGVKYRLHAPPSSVVMQEEGFGTPPLNYIVDSAPFQNGDNVRAFTLGPRPVQLVVMQNFCTRAAYWNGRASLLDTIRPNRITDYASPGKLLYYLGNGTKRQLDVFLDEGPGFQPDQDGWRKLSFTEVLRFTAHNPTWYDPSQNTATFVQSSELTLPFTLPFILGGLSFTTTVQYDGTWESFPTIVFTGPLTGATIINNDTGDKISLAYTIPDGYYVTVVLNGEKTVTRSDGLNLLPYLTSDSDLTAFSLVPDPIAPLGANSITVNGTGATGASSIALYWYNRYFGI